MSSWPWYAYAIAGLVVSALIAWGIYRFWQRFQNLHSNHTSSKAQSVSSHNSRNSKRKNSGGSLEAKAIQKGEYALNIMEAPTIIPLVIASDRLSPIDFIELASYPSPKRVPLETKQDVTQLC
jgi:hypothetical protein